MKLIISNLNIFLLSFLLPSWRAVRSYRPHLELWDPIWGDDWSHSPFIRRSPSWGCLGFSSAVRQIPGDLRTAPRIISDWRDCRNSRGMWSLARNPDRSWWHRQTSLKLFGRRYNFFPRGDYNKNSAATQILNEHQSYKVFENFSPPGNSTSAAFHTMSPNQHLLNRTTIWPGCKWNND